MANHPRTRYATTRDGVHLAYQVFGDGPAGTILHCGVNWWHLEFQWTEPHWRAFLERLGTMSRLILFDKRGTGLSDRLPPNEIPSLDARIEDLVTVLDVVGADSVVVHGSNYGAQLAMMFAASFPNRTAALIVEDGLARFVQDHDYPWGVSAEQAQRTLERIDEHWDEPVNLGLVAPSRARDDAAREWWSTMQRLSASPAAAVAIVKAAFVTDVRPVLSAIQCPTLILHRRANALIEVGHGRYLADHVAGAKYVELGGAGDLFFTPRDDVADLIEEFLTGRTPPEPSHRLLAAVLFTDLVDSTGHLQRVGDRAWRDVLDRHDVVVRRALDRYRGREVNGTGDGVIATFDGPSRAVRCAAAICEGVTALGLQARAGVHVGEIEVRGDDISGIAVHVGARVVALAGPGEVLATGTVADLAAGSGITFDDRGEHELKGVPGRWTLYSART